MKSLTRRQVAAALGAIAAVVMGFAGPPASAASTGFDGTAVLRVPAGGSSAVVTLKQRLPITGDVLRAAPSMVAGIESDELTVVVLRALESAPGSAPAQLSLLKLPNVDGGHVLRLPSGVNRDSGKEIYFGERWLAPGRYRLYVSTQRAGTLRLSMTPRGSHRPLPVSRTAGTTLVRTPPTETPLGPAAASAQGHTIELTGNGLALRVLAADLSTELGEYTVGGCLYEGGPPAGRWLPGCPGGLSTVLSTGTVAVTGKQHFSVSQLDLLPPGRWGVGSYYQFAGTARSIRHYQAFVTY